MLWLMSVLFLLQSWSPLGMLRTGSLFLLDRGMSVEEIGAIEAATLFVPAFTNPLMGVLADRLRRRKGVSIVAMVVSIGILAVLAIPRFGCKHCFWNLLVLMTVLACVALGGTVDAYTLDFLGPARTGEYGRYRLWGSVGWASSAVCTGLVMQHYGFELNFYIYGASAVVMVCSAWLKRHSITRHISHAHVHLSKASVRVTRENSCSSARRSSRRRPTRNSGAPLPPPPPPPPPTAARRAAVAMHQHVWLICVVRSSGGG